MVTKEELDKKNDRKYRCLSILPASRYFLNKRRKTLCRRIQTTLEGIRASAVPFLLPVPVCRPFLLAAWFSRTRNRECMTVGFLTMRPSAKSLRMFWRELALEISVVSLGSSQILRLPQPRTLAARAFWERRFGIAVKCWW